MTNSLGEKRRMGHIASFFVWTCAFVGGFACFPVWALFMRNYLQADSARTVSGIIGLCNVRYKHRILRVAVMWGSAAFGFFMLTMSTLTHLKNWIQ